MVALAQALFGLLGTVAENLNLLLLVDAHGSDSRAQLLQRPSALGCAQIRTRNNLVEAIQVVRPG